MAGSPPGGAPPGAVDVRMSRCPGGFRVFIAVFWIGQNRIGMLAQRSAEAEVKPLHPIGAAPFRRIGARISTVHGPLTATTTFFTPTAIRSSISPARRMAGNPYSPR